jgi:hypothetical protein
MNDEGPGCPRPSNGQSVVRLHVSVADAICEVILGSQGTADQAKRLARVCDPHSVPVVAVRWIDRQPFIEPAPGLGKPRVISLNGIRWRVADPSYSAALRCFYRCPRRRVR